jgi:3-hydroxyacyl-[acyl-carrier-protein] dehydratase
VTVSSQAFCPVGWLRIGPDHPALPGHFPGQPIVPGVVLLDLVLDIVRESLLRDAVLKGVPWVKFLEPVLPGQQIMIGLEPASPEQVRFVCRSGQNLAAQGTLVLAPSLTP